MPGIMPAKRNKANGTGVMDFRPRTNFPDIRKVCYLKAVNGTTLLVLQSNKEVRMYIPVESGSELSDPKYVTLEMMLAAARRMIAPFSLDMASCAWWSAYRVGQRVGDHLGAAHIAERLHSLGIWLSNHREGLEILIAGGHEAYVEVLVVHCAERTSVELMQLHDVFRPWNDDSGYDYWHVFAAGMSAH